MTTSVTIADDSVLLPAPSAFSEAVIRDSGSPDAYVPNAAQLDISEINAAALEFLLPSRYCEVDSELMDFAWQTFSQTRPGCGTDCRRSRKLLDALQETTEGRDLKKPPLPNKVNTLGAEASI